jgi:dienelactone hydrolase
MQRRTFLAAAAVSGLALLGSACAQQRRLRDAAPAHGAFAGSFEDDTWTDVSRSRQIPVRVRVPTNAGLWPVVLFSHGWGGSRAGGTLWGEAWVQAGFLVIHLDHSASAVTAPFAAQLKDRVLDVQFVLGELARRNKLPDSPFAHIDLNAIGLAGHSFGARTVMALAGQTIGSVPAIVEPRIKAFIALSPAAGGNDAKSFSTLRAPILFITGTNDADVVGNGETPQSRQFPFDAASPGGKYMLVLDGADHMTFGGQNDLPRPLARGRPEISKALEQRHQSLVQALTTTYWRAMLNNNEQARRMLASPASVTAPDVWRSK